VGLGKFQYEKKYHWLVDHLIYVEEADDPGMPRHSPGFPAGQALPTKIAL